MSEARWHTLYDYRSLKIAIYAKLILKIKFPYMRFRVWRFDGIFQLQRQAFGMIVGNNKWMPYTSDGFFHIVEGICFAAMHATELIVKQIRIDLNRHLTQIEANAKTN